MQPRLKKARAHPRVPVAKLRWRCPPRQLGFRDTSTLEVRPETFGQARALAALRLGLEIRSPGFNIFVVGLTGTGKTTTIRRLFEELQVRSKAPRDLCYVHNFAHPEEPWALRLPAGRGWTFRQDMRDLIDYVRRGLPEIYTSETYQKRHLKTIEVFRERGRAAFKEYETRIEAQEFRMVQIQMGPLTQAELHAMISGEPVAMEKLKDMVDAGRFDRAQFEALRRKHEKLSVDLQSTLQEGRRIEKELRESLRKLDRHFATLVIRDPIQELSQKYGDLSRVVEYLHTVQEHILDSLGKFVRPADDAEGGEVVEGPKARDLREYEVNLVVDHADSEGPPMVIESSPTHRNLFGSIDYVPMRGGGWRTDFTRIRAGSLLRANGGFLVFNLHDVTEPGVWPTLKRTLKNRKIEIRAPESPLLLASSLKPEAVDLNVKVVVIGDAMTYSMLHSYDDEFRKIFKVKADFDASMGRNQRSVQQYARFLATLARRESLLPFHSSGVAAILETGARFAGRQDRLTTRFSDIADVAREAHYWALKAGHRTISEQHVDQALHERLQRVNLLEERVQRSINDGVLLLDLRGKKIGQVNGLTVYDLGDHVFGRPARITSEVSMGRSGIINIEREANLSGSTHDKGVLILAGYLRGKYAQQRPLTLSASLAFEQSYGGIEGDSASAAELFALISAIARLPLRQDLAVTGSINQKGEIQPIGGINEKIEGFFDTCKGRGLNGTQGVVFPASNLLELMLRKDVLEAARSGKFHLYAIRRVDQGLEIMTGLKAGRRTRSGYEPDTVHGIVDDALAELAEEIKDYVEASDTVSGRPATPGLDDDDDEDGELRRRARSRPAGKLSRPGTRRGHASDRPRTRRGRARR
ncbi:MAG TPA: ATP-binding protein [Candidatus Krumholzibacteria bacterium]|nr:ATP-binding protein [Candidatus Krumholzibacteria bacterium]